MSCKHKSEYCFEVACGACLDEDLKWKTAIIDECVNSWVEWDENDPRKTIKELLKREVLYALDPSISLEAKKLTEFYKPEIDSLYKRLEQAREACDIAEEENRRLKQEVEQLRKNRYDS